MRYKEVVKKISVPAENKIKQKQPGQYCLR